MAVQYIDLREGLSKLGDWLAVEAGKMKKHFLSKAKEYPEGSTEHTVFTMNSGGWGMLETLFKYIDVVGGVGPFDLTQIFEVFEKDANGDPMPTTPETMKKMGTFIPDGSDIASDMYIKEKP